MINRILSLQTQRNKSRTNPQAGNALIYVLIAIALFAALSFTVARQTNNNLEAGTLRPEEVELAASRVLGYVSQAQSTIDQMLFTGTTIDELDFVLPGEADFDTAPNIHKVYHPSGGGLMPGKLDPKVIAQVSADPPAGWYIGRYNNVEWTESSATDVLLTAHQINPEVCANLNEKITGSAVVPAVSGGNLADFLVHARFQSASSNSDFEIANCAGCEGYDTLCVSDAGETMYSFYSIIKAR